MTNLFLVPLLNNTNMLSDQTVDLELSNPVGGFLTSPSEATLTIATVYAGPGRRLLRPAQLHRQRGGADGVHHPRFAATA